MSAKLHFDTPFSVEKSVHILNRISSEFEKLDPEPGLAYVDCQTPFGAFCKRQISALYEKNPTVGPKIDTRTVALRTFDAAERQCRATNERLRRLRDPNRDASLEYLVMRKIADILGEVPDLSELEYGFGPGASVGVSRYTSVRRKINARPTITVGSLKYVPMLQELAPHWENLTDPLVVPGGKLTTVPKNRKTDRCIVIEPLLNTVLQKGVGTYIRRRLRRVGIDLNDQSKNQALAREGSLSNLLATIDLSSASDTISRETIAMLLPIDWWILLEDLRSPAVFDGSAYVTLEKFSSMGNGFTFELESLLFYAITEVACDGDSPVSVYGDDIICPSSRYEAVASALTYFGFTLNDDKSFWDGPFRESCGGDFLRGVDIRPCYVKQLCSIKELFRLHNFFYRRGFHDLCSVLTSYIPRLFRIYGPEGFGDGHLLGDHPRRALKGKRGYGGYWFETYTSIPNVIGRKVENGKTLLVSAADYAACLYLTTDSFSPRGSDPGSGTLPSRSLFTERGGRGYKRTRVYTLG